MLRLRRFTTVLVSVAALAAGAGAGPAGAATVLRSAYAPAADAGTKPSHETGKSGSAPRTPTHRDTNPKAPASPAPAKPASPSPTAAAPDPSSSSDPVGQSDLFGQLGVRSPFCTGGGLTAPQVQNCQVSGAPEQAHPAAAYRLDIHTGGGDVLHPGKAVDGAIDSAAHHLVAVVWLGLLYAVKGVCLLVAAAFSLDLLSRLMGPVSGVLVAWRAALGPWVVPAVVLGGVAAGVGYTARRHAGEALGGMLASVALMVAAGVIVTNPAGTIGQVSHLANEGAQALVAGATTGSTDGSKARTSTGLERIFDATVTEPWAVLNFGDARWATSPPAPEVRAYATKLRNAFITLGRQSGAGACPLKILLEGGGWFDKCTAQEADQEVHAAGLIATQLARARTNAEVWLSLPAGSALRDALYNAVKKAEPQVVAIQSGFPDQRGAWLLMVALGTLGTILLFGWIALRLFDASLALLLLVLCAPVVFATAALGRSGRASAVGWLKATFGAAITRVFYALLLSLVLAVVGLLSLAQHHGVAWWLAALLQAIFSWTVFVKRRLLLERLSGGHHSHERNPLATLSALYGMRAGFHGLRAIGRAPGAALGAPIGGVGWLAGRSAQGVERRREERGQAIQSLAAERAQEEAQSLSARELTAARGIVEREELIRGDIDAARRVKGVREYDAVMELHKAGASGPPGPADEKVALVLQRRAALQNSRDTPEKVRQARKLIEQADERLASEGQPLDARDLARRVEKLGRRLDAPADALEHDPALRSDVEAWRTEQGGRARDLLGALPAGDGAGPDRAALDRAARHFSGEELRERRRELRAQLRERVRQRAAHDREMARNRRTARPR